MSLRTPQEIAQTIRTETRFRIPVLASVLVGSTLASLILDRQEILFAGLLICAVEGGVLGLMFSWLKWNKHLLVLDYFVLAMDIVAITLGLHFLGGVEFPFDWIYAVALMAIAISRGLRVGLWAAAWSIVCYAALIWAEYKGIWPHMTLFPIFVQVPLYTDRNYLVTKLLSNSAMFLAAVSTAAFFSASMKREVAMRTRELREAQVQLLHSQKLATLGQMAASLAHGLASPVTGIKGSAELLIEELAPEHPGQRRLQQILHWADHLADILERLRNLARPPKEEKSMVDINQAINDVLDLTSKLLSQRQVQVHRELDPRLPKVVGSARMLEEMLMNLVINAKDAMPDGGDLTVTSRQEGEHVRVDVADTGMGMSPEVKRRIFEAFFTTKGKHGSGLGLNICRQIIMDHGCQLQMESQEGKGSVFTVLLPTRVDLA